MSRNIIVLDLETSRSANDCQHCDCPHDAWGGYACTSAQGHCAIGWNNHAALGLSVGCYWDSSDERIHWFDECTVLDVIRLFLRTNPLLVTFNGINFDCPLMGAVGTEQHKARAMPPRDDNASAGITVFWLAFYQHSYDILAEIWKADPDGKFARGNSLDAISQANGLGAKLNHGARAQAPRDWAAGRWANVLNYCQDDAYKTKALFELVASGQPLQRPRKAPLYIRHPFTQED